MGAELYRLLRAEASGYLEPTATKFHNRVNITPLLHYPRSLLPIVQGDLVFTTSTLIIAAVALLLGGAIGHLTSRGARSSTATARELKQRLADSEERYQTYQHEVASHFVQLSQLNATMAQSYREMHEHLAASAVRLAGPEVAQKLLSSVEGAVQLHDSHGNPLLSIDDIEPPRDYAPKVPGGVLSEEYGLEAEEAENATATDTMHSGNSKID